MLAESEKFMNKLADLVNVEYIWEQICAIPKYLIVNITDAGTYEEYDAEKIFLKSDGLRVALELYGGHKVLLPPGSRIALSDTGDIEIEVLRRIKK